MPTFDGKIFIDIEEDFQHLPRAPIIEAVIDIRAQSVGDFKEENVKTFLESRLEGFNFLDAQRVGHAEFKFGEGQPQPSFKDMGFKGVRFESEDGKNFAQFNRDGFVFSRLEPYTNWDSFFSEGLEKWNIFKKLATPKEVNRLGLRFINRIKIPSDNYMIEDYIQPSPEPPRGLNLPFHGFMHHDTFAVPGYPYAINLIKTVETSRGNEGTNGLIVDIDVFRHQPFDIDDEKLKLFLREMRWLKNKTFYGTVTESAIGE